MQVIPLFALIACAVAEEVQVTQEAKAEDLQLTLDLYGGLHGAGLRYCGPGYGGLGYGGLRYGGLGYGGLGYGHDLGFGALGASYGVSKTVQSDGHHGY